MKNLIFHLLASALFITACGTENTPEPDNKPAVKKAHEPSRSDTSYAQERIVRDYTDAATKCKAIDYSLTGTTDEEKEEIRKCITEKYDEDMFIYACGPLTGRDPDSAHQRLIVKYIPIVLKEKGIE